VDGSPRLPEYMLAITAISPIHVRNGTF